MRALGSSGTTARERTAIIRAEEAIMTAGLTERRNVGFVISREIGRNYGTHCLLTSFLEHKLNGGNHGNLRNHEN